MLAFDNIGYAVPSEPCLYRTINTSYVWSQYSPENVALFQDILITNQILTETPCELSLQMPSLLQSKSMEYLIEYAYWFSTPIQDNNGQCDIHNETNIALHGLDCANGTFNGSTARATDKKCFANDECIYPFALSKYRRDITTDLGMCYCGTPCDIYPYPGDIQVLDIFTHCCNWLTVALIFGYFYNLYLEVKQIKTKRNKWSKMPLTFDIPFICACNLSLFSIALILPSLMGKDTFVCETGTRAMVISRDLPYSNWACFVQGSIEYIALTAMYNYCALLSFCVWRYLSAPMNPLYGIRKRYWHIGVWIYVFSLYIPMAARRKIDTVVAIGLCVGSLVDEPDNYIFSWYPFILVMIVFAVTTPLSVFKIYGQLTRNRQFMAKDSTKHVSRKLIHLSIRLVIYSLFLFASLVCWMYVNGKIIFEYKDWEIAFGEYLQCMYLEKELPFLYAIEYPNQNGCTMSPEKLPMAPYFMQGAIELLIAIASFSLSCSNVRTDQWRESSQRILSRMTSAIGSTQKSGDDEDDVIPIPEMGSVSRTVGSRTNLKQTHANMNKFNAGANTESVINSMMRIQSLSANTAPNSFDDTPLTPDMNAGASASGSGSGSAGADMGTAVEMPQIVLQPNATNVSGSGSGSGTGTGITSDNNAIEQESTQEQIIETNDNIEDTQDYYENGNEYGNANDNDSVLL